MLPREASVGTSMGGLNRYLTRKMFLLVLTSAKRANELHILSYNVIHTQDWSSYHFLFVLELVGEIQILHNRMKVIVEFHLSVTS